VVSGLSAGLSLEAAAERAITELRGLDVPDGEPIMQLVAIDAGGHHTALSTRPGTSYVAWEEGHEGYVTLPRKVVSLTD
jgi:hypothetical protein